MLLWIKMKPTSDIYLSFYNFRNFCTEFEFEANKYSVELDNDDIEPIFQKPIRKW